MAPAKVCTPWLIALPVPYTYILYTYYVSRTKWGEVRDIFTLSNHILGNVFLHNSLVAASLPDFLESTPRPQARLTQCQQLSAAHQGFICCQRMSNSRPGLPHPRLSLWPGLQRKMKQISALSLWVQNCKTRMDPKTQTFNSVGPRFSPRCPPARKPSLTATSYWAKKPPEQPQRNSLYPAFHLQRTGLSTAPSIQDGGGIVRCGTSINISERNRWHEKRWTWDLFGLETKKLQGSFLFDGLAFWFISISIPNLYT